MGKTEYNIKDIISVRERIKGLQTGSRYEHTLGVAYTAACMAFIFGEDPLKAELTGLLHDCAKCYSDSELIQMCTDAGIALSKAQLDSPAVIHAIYGRLLAERDFGICDEDILNSIEYHTTGRPCMSRLEKIIFAADYIEPLRDKASDLPIARQLAFSDLDKCVFEILDSTIRYLRNTGRHIVPETISAHNYYAEITARVCNE